MPPVDPFLFPPFVPRRSRSGLLRSLSLVVVVVVQPLATRGWRIIGLLPFQPATLKPTRSELLICMRSCALILRLVRSLFGGVPSSRYSASSFSPSFSPSFFLRLYLQEPGSRRISVIFLRRRKRVYVYTCFCDRSRSRMAFRKTRDVDVDVVLYYMTVWNG